MIIINCKRVEVCSFYMSCYVIVKIRGILLLKEDRIDSRGLLEVFFIDS